MSLLEKVHRKIYQKEYDNQKRKLGQDVYNPVNNVLDERDEKLGNIKKELSSDYGRDELFEKVDNRSGRFLKKNKKILLIGLSLFSLIIVSFAAFLIFVKYKESLFDPEKVAVSIQGPEEIKSGMAVNYKIKVENKNRARLMEAKIKVNFSKELKLKETPFLSEIQMGSAVIDPGILNGMGLAAYDLEFNVFGAKDTQGYIEVLFSYKPNNFESRFESKGQFGFVIKSSALEITLVPTKEAASGELMEIQTIIENKGEEQFDNVAVLFDYPMAFSFVESDPEPSEKNNQWMLGGINPGEQRKIILRGILNGEVNSVKNFSAKIGQNQGQGDFLVFAGGETTIKIISARVQLVNILKGANEIKTVKAGDTISTVLKFKNTSDEPLRDLILTEKISSPVIDKTSFNVIDGFYDSTNEQIIWKASQVTSLKNLNPQQEGQVEFSFRIKKDFPMNDQADKNFVVVIQPEIESLDIASALGQNKKISGIKSEIKVTSKLVLDISGNYNDSEISNDGPYPPKAGEKSTFTMRFNLRNTSNDLREAVMRINLPAGVSWENEFLPGDEKIEFNERTNELFWKLGTISAGTGFFSPVRDLVFKLGLIPSENQVYPSPASIELINGIKVTAFDTFTEESVEYTFNNFKVGQLSDY